jgi:hypothetical protein
MGWHVDRSNKCPTKSFVNERAGRHGRRISLRESHRLIRRIIARRVYAIMHPDTRFIYCSTLCFRQGTHKRADASRDDITAAALRAKLNFIADRLSIIRGSIVNKMSAPLWANGMTWPNKTQYKRFLQSVDEKWTLSGLAARRLRIHLILSLSLSLSRARARALISGESARNTLARASQWTVYLRVLVQIAITRRRRPKSRIRERRRRLPKIADVAGDRHFAQLFLHNIIKTQRRVVYDLAFCSHGISPAIISALSPPDRSRSSNQRF